MVILYDSKGVFLKSLIGHEGNIMCLAFTPDSKKIVSSGRDKTIRIWDISSGAIVGEPLKGHDYGIRSVAVSPNGKMLISVSCDDWKIKFWDIEIVKQIEEPEVETHLSNLMRVCFSKDGQIFATCGRRPSINLWMAGTRKLLKPIDL